MGVGSACVKPRFWIHNTRALAARLLSTKQRGRVICMRGRLSTELRGRETITTTLVIDTQLPALVLSLPSAKRRGHVTRMCETTTNNQGNGYTNRQLSLWEGWQCALWLRHPLIPAYKKVRSERNFHIDLFVCSNLFASSLLRSFPIYTRDRRLSLQLNPSASVQHPATNRKK